MKREIFKLFKTIPIIMERKVNSNKIERNSTNHIRKEIGQKCNASNVTNLVTLITFVQNEKKFKQL